MEGACVRLRVKASFHEATEEQKLVVCDPTGDSPGTTRCQEPNVVVLGSTFPINRQGLRERFLLNLARMT